MKFFLTVLGVLWSLATVQAQSVCASQEYLLQEVKKDPSLLSRLQKAEAFSNNQLHQEWLSGAAGSSPSPQLTVIRIPVVVHIIYNKAEQNITDAQVRSQLDVLNQEFRKKHADTSLIPAAFRPLAADCHFEFSLATINPDGYATSGIVRKATGRYSFGVDDKIKFSATGGDDAWDSERYLNIWVGNMVSGVIGYSSALGGPKEKDGIVVTYFAFGTTGKASAPYNKGRTAIHEIGHWMGLRHIWGDQICGSDGIDDTPQQSDATRGCPGGVIKASCNSSAAGVMYNNYMDLTNDACTNMFTLGQRDKMRASFLPGGAHHSLTLSNTATATPLPDPEPELPAPLKVIKVYPNPSSSRFRVDVGPNEALIGQLLTVHNQLGQQVMQVKLTSTVTEINLSAFRDGVYFLRANGAAQPVKVLKAATAQPL
jgi:Pregnancy-associated plasma protein-A/Secretion system C-terminal sorting domain